MELTVDDESGVTAIIYQQVRAAFRPHKGLLRAPPVLLQRLPLPGENAGAVASGGSSSVVLR